jgi:predicted AAA+ superfamily ATPase
MKEYIRKPLFNVLQKGLKGEPRLVQVIVGPRQVGKTTLALQLYDRWKGPKLYKSADLPNIPTINWVITQWEEARALCQKGKGDTLLVLDEIQKIPRWSEVVKKMFDEDKRLRKPMRVVLLGSSSLLMQRGLVESLAGRFEIHRHNHWSFFECKEYFNLKLEEYLYFGGYPGAIPLRKDEPRWGKYIRDSLIETVLSKDVILMSPITKPALLRQVFGLCLAHPAEILSYQKMIGQLQDAGNTTTIASYLRLLSNAFLLTPLEKYSGSKIRQRGSMPKILVLDNALISATIGQGFKATLKDKIFWGRMVENAVGAKLYPILKELGGELFYWRYRNDEVDYVAQIGQRLIAIEVKSGSHPKSISSLKVFARRYKKTEKIVIFQPEINGTPEQVKKDKEEKNIKRLSLQDFFSNPSKSLGM